MKPIQIIIALLGILALTINFLSPTIKENFWGGIQLSTKPMNVDSRTNRPVLGSNIAQDFGHNFVSTPSYQAMINPRFNSNGYGAFINYDMPSVDKLAVPLDPLGQSPQHIRRDVKALNRVENFDNDQLPIGNMMSGDSQPIIMERLMFAPQKSRLRALGDPIRGDLPIIPERTGRYDVNPNVGVDLNPGAINVLGGMTDSSREFAQMVNKASGGVMSTFGGIDVSSVNVANSHNVYSHNGDIQVAQF